MDHHQDEGEPSSQLIKFLRNVAIQLRVLHHEDKIAGDGEYFVAIVEI